MTHIRYDADRQRITQRCATVFGWLTTPGHTPHNLRAKIDLAIEDGLKGTAYDGDGRGGGDGTSAPERAAINERSDRACEDLERLDHLLAEAAKIEAELFGIIDRHDPITQRKAGDSAEKRTVGKGTAPKNLCQVCWSHKRETEREGDFALWCNLCGNYKRLHGERPMIRQIWEELHARGHVSPQYLRRYAPHLVPKEKSA